MTGNVALLVLTAGLVAPLLTYLGVVRKLSGKVATSDAAQLWEESRAIRKDLQERNQILHGIIDKCELRLERLEAKNEALTGNVRTLEETIRGLKAIRP